MNKNILKWSFLALLIVATAYLTLRNNLSTLGSKKANFQFSEIEITDSIIITSPFDKASIIAQGKNWEVDGSKVKTKRFVFLLEALKNLQSISPMDRAEMQEWQNKMDKTATRVQAYSGDKIIYDISFISVEDMNIGLMKGNDTYNRIAIQGFDGVPLTELIKAQPSFWQANVLINLAHTEISDISIVYVNESENSFRLALADLENFRLLNYKGKQIENKLDSSKIYNYLHFFTGIQYEEPDTLRYQIPPNPEELIFTFRTSNTNNKVIQIDAYPLKLRQSGETDLNKFCAVVGNNSFIALKYSQFDPILAEIDYFLKE